MANKEIALLEDMAEKGFTIELIGRNIIVKLYGEELTSSYFIEDDNKSIDLRKELSNVCKYYIENSTFETSTEILDSITLLHALVKEHVN